MINIKHLVYLLALMTVVACQNTKEKQEETQADASTAIEVTGVPSYRIGDEVPHDLVCMVNNAYMGKKQFEVPFEGRMYYGCCNMCVERIQTDEGARTAVDPYSSKEIDKSEAFIVLVSSQGHVAYFETEENYKSFLAQQ
ncbi:MAG TPA: hypothetical protein VK014_11905 [Cyclobacteriaceae bacterium]|nr:hypothetical protein [Cyclobacteriaceae bacterium]